MFNIAMTVPVSGWQQSVDRRPRQVGQRTLPYQGMFYLPVYRIDDLISKMYFYCARYISYML